MPALPILRAEGAGARAKAPEARLIMLALSRDAMVIARGVEAITRTGQVLRVSESSPFECGRTGRRDPPVIPAPSRVTVAAARSLARHPWQLALSLLGIALGGCGGGGDRSRE